MHRRLLLVVSVAVLLLVGMSSVNGQEASPVASPAAEQPLDLAAMVLKPADLEAYGLVGFGQDTGQYREQAGQYPAGTARLSSALMTAGWLRDYQLDLGVPVEAGNAATRTRTSISSYVVEFTNAAAVATLFDQNANDPRSGTRTIGDRSKVARYEVDTSGRPPFVVLELTFQLDRFFAGVALYEYTGQEPDLATLEALAETLLAKINAVQADNGPGLLLRALRLSGEDLVAVNDAYLRIDGVSIPEYNESADAFAGRSARMGDATDVFIVSQRLAVGGEDPADDVAYQNVVYRFPDEAAAAAWLRAGSERLSQIRAYVAVQPLPDAASIGDESQTFALDVQRDGQVARGYLIYSRVGRDVTGVQVFAQPEAPLTGLQEMATVQAACLRAQEPCPLIPIPAAFVEE